MNHYLTRMSVFAFMFSSVWFANLCWGDNIGQWEQLKLQFDNPSWEGNPFDVVLEGHFTSPTGCVITHFGFYAGDAKWKINFMPDEVGMWSYKTESSDKDLDGKRGEFTCINSKLAGPLMPSSNRWAFTSGGGDFPVIWNPTVSDGEHWGFRGRNLSDPMVQEALQFADEVVGARFLAFGELFVTPIDWAKNWPQSAVPYVVGKEGEEFYLPFWDQLNAKLDAARERNMGAYIMIYGDDGLKPDRFGVMPRSKKELRFFRYIVARLACYPHILWDTGIDIGEYRNNEWINWYTDWFREHDPWHHPVGSRSGGGSGGIMPKNGTYFSTGGASIPSRSTLMEFYKSDVPVAHTDHWRPFISRGNWTHQKIRVVTWRCGLSGTQALFPDYNQGAVQYDQVKKGGAWIGFATRFFQEEVRSDLLDLQPHDELIVAGENAILAANPSKEYILYDEDGGKVTINLTATQGALQAQWYNPRNGKTVRSARIKEGTMHTFSSPTEGQDWVLHIYTN